MHCNLSGFRFWCTVSLESAMKSTERPRLKYEELAATLREKVTPLSSGSRLPSVRGLMKRYRVSLQTVNAALNILEKENLIVTRQGSGSYVSEYRQVKLIALHRSRHPSAFEDEKEESLRTAFQSKGWHLETRRHDGLSLDFGANLVPESKACAHIVMQDLTHLKQSLIDQLAQQNVPVMIFGRESESGNVDYITSNEPLAISLLIKHLRSLGHHHIAMLVNEPSVYHEIAKRTQSFVEILELLDLPPGIIIDCGTQPGQRSAHAAHTGLKQYIQGLRGAPLPFSAMIVTSSSGGFGALRAFHECGIRIPEACSVVSFGAEAQNTLSIPSLTDAGTPIGMFGKWVVDLLQKRFDGDPAPAQGFRLPVELTVRESTCRMAQIKQLSTTA